MKFLPCRAIRRRSLCGRLRGRRDGKGTHRSPEGGTGPDLGDLRKRLGYSSLNAFNSISQNCVSRFWHGAKRHGSKSKRI
jgi:hypothetical protein